MKLVKLNSQKVFKTITPPLSLHLSTIKLNFKKNKKIKSLIFLLQQNPDRCFRRRRQPHPHPHHGRGQKTSYSSNYQLIFRKQKKIDGRKQLQDCSSSPLNKSKIIMKSCYMICVRSKLVELSYLAMLMKIVQMMKMLVVGTLIRRGFRLGEKGEKMIPRERRELRGLKKNTGICLCCFFVVDDEIQVNFSDQCLQNFISELLSFFLNKNIA